MAVKARRPSNQNRLTHPPICVPRQGSHYRHVPLARDVMFFCTAGDRSPFARPTHDRSSTSSRLATRGYGSKAVGPARRGRFGQQSGQTGCSQMSTMWRVSKCIARPPCPIILQINSKDIRSCQPENVGRPVGRFLVDTEWRFEPMRECQSLWPLWRSAPATHRNSAR